MPLTDTDINPGQHNKELTDIKELMGCQITILKVIVFLPPLDIELTNFLSSSAILSLSSKRRQKEDSNECKINQVVGARGDVGRGWRDRFDHRISRREARTSRLSVQDERDGGRYVRERELHRDGLRH